MIPTRLFLPALALACAVPTAAEAQRLFAGAGGALTAIVNTGNETTAFRPGVHAVVGVRVGRGVAVGIEGTQYGLGDDESRTTDFVPGTTTFARRPEVVGTRTLFAFVQVDAGPVYLRPGAGVGLHASPGYLFGPEDRVLDVSVDYEGGLAAGLAVGVRRPARRPRVRALRGRRRLERRRGQHQRPPRLRPPRRPHLHLLTRAAGCAASHDTPNHRDER